MSPKKPASTCMDDGRLGLTSVCWQTTPYVAALFLSAVLATSEAGVFAQSTVTPSPPAADSAEGENPAADEQARLLAVKRICVANLSGDEKFARQVEDMLISSLVATKRFRVTESCDKADATLKGTATENKEVVSRYEDEGVGFGKSAGGVHGSWDRSGGSVSGGAAGVAGMASETLASNSVRNSTNLAVRLVSGDGEVIWATTQESTGSKIKGPAADLADRAVKQLIRDLDKATAPPVLDAN